MIHYRCQDSQVQTEIQIVVLLTRKILCKLNIVLGKNINTYT